ncbi:MAG: hypothetical protein WHT06_05820 [Desulfobacterales bacterium]
MEPVVFPRPVPATGRAERVNPAEPRRDAGKEQAFRRFLQHDGEESPGTGEEPGRKAASPGEARGPEDSVKGVGGGRAEEDPCRGRRIDIRI